VYKLSISACNVIQSFLVKRSSTDDADDIAPKFVPLLSTVVFPSSSKWPCQPAIVLITVEGYHMVVNTNTPVSRMHGGRQNIWGPIHGTPFFGLRTVKYVWRNSVSKVCEGWINEHNSNVWQYFAGLLWHVWEIKRKICSRNAVVQQQSEATWWWHFCLTYHIKQQHARRNMVYMCWKCQAIV